ncbi:MAG: ABC transporter substrate-binding protein [Actinobacteria bacterium]|nr:ABC transporter substrate-binding protein [Actinomycetota bacterium]
MKLSRLVGFAGLFLLVPTLVACGDDSSENTTTEATAAEATTTIQASAFPVTVDELTLESEPQRIVSMSATATEMLFAIGAGDKVIAVDNFSNYPAETASLDKVDAYQPNVEAISALEPDLVIISYDPGNLVEQLNALSIPVFAAYAVVNLEGAYEQIEQLGALTGRLAEAVQVSGAMQEEIAEIVAGITKTNPPLTYFYELDPTLYTVTSNTFIGGVMSALGLASVADGVEAGNDYPQLSAEVLVEKDPSIIFLADTKCCAQSLETVAARDGWAGLTAVQTGSVVELDDDIASRWGPRLVELVRVVAEAVTSVLAKQ